MNVLITKRNAGGAQRYRENHSGWNTQGRRVRYIPVLRGGKETAHCGRCSELPCSRYDQQDPARTPEENAAGLKKMLEVLRSLD